MTRVRRLLRARVDVHCCDECARVETCDAGCYAGRARQTATTGALGLSVRL